MPASMAASTAPSCCGTRSSASTSGSECRARVDGREQRIHALAGERGDGHLAARADALRAAPARSSSSSRSILFSTSMRGLARTRARPAPSPPAPSALRRRRSGVADVQQHLGLRHLFERGAKAGDQRVRQVADEADRVGQQHLAAAGQFDGAQFGVERGEHARR